MEGGEGITEADVKAIIRESVKSHALKGRLIQNEDFGFIQGSRIIGTINENVLPDTVGKVFIKPEDGIFTRILKRIILN